MRTAKCFHNLPMTLVILIIAWIGPLHKSVGYATVPVTFQVNMRVQILEKKFIRNTDQLSVRAQFNNWAQGINRLTDADGDSIFTTTANLEDFYAGTMIAFEYFYTHGGRGVGEILPDRQFFVPVGGGTVPLVFFDGDAVVTPGATLFPTVSSPQPIGTQFWIDVKVGETSNPVSNLFGVSFELNFGQTSLIDVVTPHSSNVVAGSFMGTDVVFLPTVDEANGKVSIGVSRKAGQGGVSGTGTVARVRFVSAAGTPFNSRIDFFVTSISANDPDGNLVPLNPGALTITIGPCAAVSSISPTSGAVGSSVTITGTNFTGVTAVNFSNNVAALFTVNSATQIVATVPAGAVSGPITLVKGGSCNNIQTANFTVIGTPCQSISGINPTSGTVGTSVTITGTNFDGVTGVKFSNNVTANFTVNAAGTQITTSVPSGAVTGSITVSKAGCSDVRSGTFTVVPCPSISSINPTIGPVGMSVTITGTNFTGVTGVKFSNNVTATFTVNSATQITTTVPSGAVTGSITVSKTGCSDVQSATFTVVPCPSISSINPTSGAVGASVTITGANFTGATSVKFSNNVTATFTVNSTTQITTTVPSGAVTGPITVSKTGCGDVFTSSFTVVPPPDRRVRVTNASGPSGSTVSVPIELDSQGDENALSFSLSFNQSILSSPQVSLGRDAGTGTLNVNTAQANLGRMGIILALPAGQKFTAGTREIAVVSFLINSTTNAASAVVSFIDLPISRDIVNITAGSLVSTWISGTITITGGLEADVAPRLNVDGRVTTVDWVQVGRFVALLDTPRTATKEFQKSDCAPRPCGNGIIGLADWVQAGRYAAALDPTEPACGPTATANLVAGENVESRNKVATDRSIRIMDAELTAGETGYVVIQLEAQGDENAAGFSLNFDAGVLSFQNVELAEGATGAMLIVNDTQSAQGTIGVVLALSPGQTFSQGTYAIIRASFSANVEASSSTTSLEFVDLPIAKEVVTAAGEIAAASWMAGTISIGNTTGVQENDEGIPTRFELLQNHPNPFNPTTVIGFSLPRTAKVTLKIYDVLGGEVATLAEGEYAAGRHHVEWNAGEVKSGVYFYRLQSAEFVQTRKLVLMK